MKLGFLYRGHMKNSGSLVFSYTLGASPRIIVRPMQTLLLPINKDHLPKEGSLVMKMIPRSLSNLIMAVLLGILANMEWCATIIKLRPLLQDTGFLGKPHRHQTYTHEYFSSLLLLNSILFVHGSPFSSFPSWGKMLTSNYCCTSTCYTRRLNCVPYHSTSNIAC